MLDDTAHAIRRQLGHVRLLSAGHPAGRHDLEGSVPKPGNRDGLLLVRRTRLRQRRSANGESD